MQEHDQDQDEKALSDLYAELSQEQPSSSLDEKILAEAHKAVEPVKFGKKASSPFSVWAVPVSLAAVIVLSVTVVVMIEKKRPYSLTSAPDRPAVERLAEPEIMEPAPAMAKRKAPMADADDAKVIAQAKKESKARVAAEAEVQLQSVAKLRSAEVETQQTSPVKAKAKRADSGISHMESPLAGKESKVGTADVATTQMTEEKKLVKAEGAAGAVNEENVERIENTITAGIASDETASLARQETREVASLTPLSPGPKQAAPPAAQPKTDTSKPMIVQQQSQATDVEQEAQKQSTQMADQQAPVEKLAMAVAKDVEEQAAVVATSREKSVTEEPQALAQTGVAVSEAEPALAGLQSMIAPAKEKSAPVTCSSMSITDCAGSTDCLVQWNSDNKSYLCREPLNACERDFIQISNNRQTCESAAGCKFVPANCFCLPETQCDCDSGPPAMCVPQIPGQ